jgi:hypothetical protein
MVAFLKLGHHSCDAGVPSERTGLPTIQHQKTKSRIGREFGDPYGIAPEYKLSIAGRMAPSAQPYHFRRWPQNSGEFVKIRVGGDDDESACLNKFQISRSGLSSKSTSAT